MTWNNDNDDQQRPNPWGANGGKANAGGNKDNNRPNNRPNPNQQDDIDFDALFRKAKTIFDNNMSGGNNGTSQHSGRYLSIGLMIAVALWL
jgi:hypothetical protein